MNPSANTPPAATARDYSAKPYRTAWVAAWWFIDFAITATAVATGQLSGLSLNYLYLVIGIFLLGLQTDVVLQLPEHATPRAIYVSSAMSAVMCLAMLEPGRFVSIIRFIAGLAVLILAIRYVKDLTDQRFDKTGGESA
ncbi:hypothetical protein [Corynebacterium argentoratense]|uniref:hypothetical protein n=1 Tax=Corynebacterium argentoratense TaxID=42817 RepID=UPI001F40902C|nr:hypothetical protein [Corynebacterium argentoratense]MCF1693540.1 hypothetical protein [Corynebacterium argentoratense]MCF1734731.1 hypothetical protein [Corynebacterium argentoratense]